MRSHRQELVAQMNCRLRFRQDEVVPPRPGGVQCTLVAALRMQVQSLQRKRDALAERLRPTATHVGSRIDVETTSDLIGQWDVVRIEQVVTNLLSNAVKFGAGAPISVHVFAHGGSAMVVVCDEGPGIPPEVLPKMFERFERAAPIEKFGGLGIGLFIARELVEAHGGSIRAENRPSGGAQFTVALPLSAPGAAIRPGELTVCTCHSGARQRHWRSSPDLRAALPLARPGPSPHRRATRPDGEGSSSAGFLSP